MADFFIGTQNRLPLFGALHIGLTVGAFILYALVFAFRKKLSDCAHLKAIRISMALVLLLNMAVHYSSRLLLGIWRFEEDLPLHLCFIANFLLIYIMLTDDRRGLYGTVYFFTLIGPLPAMLFPDLSYSCDSFIFYQFVISHHFMLLCSLFCLLVFGYKSSPQNVPSALITGNLLVASVMVFNKVFGTNYIMTDELPAQLYEHFPFLAALPPLFWLELSGVVCILVACIPLIFLSPKCARIKESVHHS